MGEQQGAKLLSKDEARRIAADKRKAPGANRGFVRQSSGGPIYFRTPRACRVPIITTDMPAAIRPYSIAFAPENRFIIAFM
jgi:hypothetical protein